ncbi:methyltransferase domain-containing protein [Rufibacter immobilis]
MLQKLKNIVYSASATFLPPKKECPVCGNKVYQFKPLSPSFLLNYKKYGWPYSLDDLETLNVASYECPKCGCSDRDRLYALYFNKALSPTKTYQLLDIAPAASLRHFLQRKSNINYRSADLFMEDVDDKVDLTNMHLYPDNWFDIFVCSHVLEHVPDDRKAMQELYRVLKPGGWGIAMVPILLSLPETDEDPTLQDVQERWRRYGQDDHVRQYAKHSFINRLQQTGFHVQEVNITDFTAQDFITYGIHPRSVLYIVSK